jgi:hypothetical protein
MLQRRLSAAFLLNELPGGFQNELEAGAALGRFGYRRHWLSSLVSFNVKALTPHAFMRSAFEALGA